MRVPLRISMRSFNSSIYRFCFAIVCFCFFRIFSDFFSSLTKSTIIFRSYFWFLSKFFTLSFDYDALSEYLLIDRSFFDIFALIRINCFFNRCISESFCLCCLLRLLLARLSWLNVQLLRLMLTIDLFMWLLCEGFVCFFLTLPTTYASLSDSKTKLLILTFSLFLS